MLPRAKEHSRTRGKEVHRPLREDLLTQPSGNSSRRTRGGATAGPTNSRDHHAACETYTRTLSQRYTLVNICISHSYNRQTCSAAIIDSTKLKNGELNWNPAHVTRSPGKAHSLCCCDVTAKTFYTTSVTDLTSCTGWFSSKHAFLRQSFAKKPLR